MKLVVGEHESIDLEFDERFLIIDQLISEHEADFDAPLRRGQEPFDWGRIATTCESLSQETNDLRVAAWWLRARAETDGLPGWAAGLQYILDLLRLPVEGVFPQGDAEISTGELHATALCWLCSARSLATFRKLPLTSDRAWLIAGLLPDALGSKPLAESDQIKLKEAVVAEGCADRVHGLLEEVRSCLAEISSLLDERSSEGGGDFADLISTVGHAAHRLAPLVTPSAVPVPEGSQGQDAQSEPQKPVSSASGGPGFASSAQVGPGFSIHTRDEVRIVLEALNRYYAEHESGHPAPIFIQRLQRMIDMSFDLLIRELFSESEVLLNRLVKPASN